MESMNNSAFAEGDAAPQTSQNDLRSDDEVSAIEPEATNQVPEQRGDSGVDNPIANLAQSTLSKLVGMSYNVSNFEQIFNDYLNRLVDTEAM